jgi:hypothetical protein
MQNKSYMTDHFESQKNAKASGYTLLICILLAIIIVFVTWTLPNAPQPPVEDGIEVNLGNNDQGLGNDQAYLPGKPSPNDQQKYTPPKQAVVEKTAAKDVETNDKEEDVPAIKKPAVTKPNATKIPDKDLVKNKPVRVLQPVVQPTPNPPKPKAVFHGVNGTGKGGNDADTYKPGGNQGIAGGHGDQGQPGGDPNAANYTGGGRGNSGVNISKGLAGRYFTRTYKYEGDFNENATVYIDVTVDKTGNVLSADYQPRGSTTSENYYKEKAIEIVKKSRLNVDPNGADEQTGTVYVKFKVRG